VDTSVFGGVFDAEFAGPSTAFFDGVLAGRFVVMLGATTLTELRGAPDRVIELAKRLPTDAVYRCDITPEVEELRDAYLVAKVVGPTSTYDATHVATATVHDADVVVSWNFKHIVNFDRIRKFNAVNLRLGFRAIAIHSPQELQYADEP